MIVEMVKIKTDVKLDCMCCFCGDNIIYYITLANTRIIQRYYITMGKLRSKKYGDLSKALTMTANKNNE